MGKRAAAATSPKAKAAKVTKGKAAPAADGATAPGPLAPVLDFLDKIELPEPCRQMLKAAAPFALKTPKEQRHGHQASIVKELAELYAQAEQRHMEDLSKANAAVTEHAKASDCAKATLEETTACVAKMLQDKQAKNIAHEAANDGVAKAKAALQDEQTKAASIAKDKGDLEEKQSEFDQVMQADFRKLVPSEFSSKDWRTRNKAISRVLERLGHAEVGQTLIEALPVALKTSAAERGKFALVTVEHAEAAIKDHMAAMTAAISGFDAPAAEQAQAVTAAEQAVASAEALAVTAWQELVNAENQWVEEQGKKDDQTAAVRSVAPQAQALAQQVEEASRALERFTGSLAHFKALAEQATLHPEADQEAIVKASLGPFDASGQTLQVTAAAVPPPDLGAEQAAAAPKLLPEGLAVVSAELGA